MKKVLVLMILLSIFVGCANEQSSNSPVEIEFWHAMSGARGDVFAEIVEAFNASQDDVIVKATYQGTYGDLGAKLQSAVATGNPPEVAQCEIGRIGLYAFENALVDMTEYFEKDNISVGDFIPGLMTYSYYDDKLISLPSARSTPVFYYNKDMFDAAGLTKAPETWEELREYAEILTTDGVAGFTMPTNDAWYFLAFVMSTGANIFNDTGNNIGFYGEAGESVLEYWLEMIEDGLFEIPGGKEYNASEATRSNFTAGRTAMIVQSTGSLTELVNNSNFEVSAGFIPRDVRNAVPPGGANLMMLGGHDTENEQAAWEFMKFMTSTENSAKWAIETGYFPTRYSSLELPEYATILDANPNVKITIDQLEYANYPSPFVPEYAEVKDLIIPNEIERCILEYPEVTPKMAIDAIYEKTAELFK